MKKKPTPTEQVIAILMDVPTEGRAGVLALLQRIRKARCTHLQEFKYRDFSIWAFKPYNYYNYFGDPAEAEQKHYVIQLNFNDDDAIMIPRRDFAALVAAMESGAIFPTL